MKIVSKIELIIIKDIYLTRNKKKLSKLFFKKSLSLNWVSDFYH